MAENHEYRAIYSLYRFATANIVITLILINSYVPTDFSCLKMDILTRLANKRWDILMAENHEYTAKACTDLKL